VPGQCFRISITVTWNVSG